VSAIRGNEQPPTAAAAEADGTTQDALRRVLFVCTGNICRSPTAEVVFRTRAERAGLANRLMVASAGTGDWHAGMPPDRRAQAHAAKRGYDLSSLRARQVAVSDFDLFDWVLAMDKSNLRDLKALRPAAYQGTLGLFLDFAPQLGLRDVPDPYYGGASHFERVLDLIEQASDALLAHLFGRHASR
jgi:protein-tyrosine phosphatase